MNRDDLHDTIADIVAKDVNDSAVATIVADHLIEALQHAGFPVWV